MLWRERFARSRNLGHNDHCSGELDHDYHHHIIGAEHDRTHDDYDYIDTATRAGRGACRAQPGSGRTGCRPCAGLHR